MGQAEHPIFNCAYPDRWDIVGRIFLKGNRIIKAIRLKLLI